MPPPLFPGPALNRPAPASLLRRFAGVRFWPVWLLLGVLRLLAVLPLPVIYAIGATLGGIAYLLHRPRRAITRRNLRACFPDKPDGEINALARAHFRYLSIAVLASGVAWWGSKARLAGLTRFRNRELYDRACERGDNIILLAPHCTGLEFAGIFLSALAPTVCMYRRHKNPLMDELIRRHRRRFGAQLFARNDPVKPLLRELRRGRQFYYLPDQDPGRSGGGVFAPFYGIPTATFAALGRIARLGDAAVIPCFTRLLPGGRGFEIIFAPPLPDYPAGDDLADATAMNRAIETLIPHAPAQYFWSHRRFKTRPPGEPPFYD